MYALAKCLRWLLALLVTMGVVLFAVNNPSTVDINLFPFPYIISTPVFLIVLAGMLFGALLGGAVSGLTYRFQRRDLARLRCRNHAMENELAGLKSEHAATSV